MRNVCYYFLYVHLIYKPITYIISDAIVHSGLFQTLIRLLNILRIYNGFANFIYVLFFMPVITSAFNYCSLILKQESAADMIRLLRP